MSLPLVPKLIRDQMGMLPIGERYTPGFTFHMSNEQIVTPQELVVV